MGSDSFFTVGERRDWRSCSLWRGDGRWRESWKGISFGEEEASAGKGKDRKDAVNANPAILNRKLRHFLLPRGSPVPASRGPKPQPGKYLQRSNKSATGRSSAKGYLRRKNFISVKPTFPCCHSVWKFRTASLPLHTREHTHTHTHTHFAALSVQQANI